eukprot:4060287-Prymnesium_polylepis.1
MYGLFITKNSARLGRKALLVIPPSAVWVHVRLGCGFGSLDRPFDRSKSILTRWSIHDDDRGSATGPGPTTERAAGQDASAGANAEPCGGPAMVARHTTRQFSGVPAVARTYDTSIVWFSAPTSYDTSRALRPNLV